jgi:hypothetical protein
MRNDDGPPAYPTGGPSLFRYLRASCARLHDGIKLVEHFDEEHRVGSRLCSDTCLKVLKNPEHPAMSRSVHSKAAWDPTVFVSIGRPLFVRNLVPPVIAHDGRSTLQVTLARVRMSLEPAACWALATVRRCSASARIG